MPDACPALSPLPPWSRVEALPGTVRRADLLEGGVPRRRVHLTTVGAAVTDALLAGASVEQAAAQVDCPPATAGAIGRRLLTAAFAGPVSPTGVTGGAATRVVGVIPAHDASSTIVAAIAGLEGVDEIVVVDDGSTDDTAAVAEAAGALVLRHERPRGPAAARNRGIAATAADVVVLLDSDARPEPGWLMPLLAHLADPAVGGAAPRVLTIDDGSDLGRYEAGSGPLDRGLLPCLVRPDGPVPFVSTTALVLRRDLWEHLGGFDEALRFGEDLDFVWRAASHQPLVYEPCSRVHHHHRADLRSHLRNRADYGSAAGPLHDRGHGHPRVAVATPLLTASAVAAIAGLPHAAGVTAVASVLGATRRLRDAGEPAPRAAADALAGAVRSVRGLAAAVSRPWLPLALVAAIVRRPARPVVIGALGARLVLSRRADTSGLRARKWLVLRFLDDLASSLGVVRGCLASRTVLPLTTRAPAGDSPMTTPLGQEVVLP